MEESGSAPLDRTVKGIPQRDKFHAEQAALRRQDGQEGGSALGHPDARIAVVQKQVGQQISGCEKVRRKEHYTGHDVEIPCGDCFQE